MINKITFLLNQTLNKWNYDRFGFDILKMNGFDVSVFDLTPYEYPDIYKWNNKNENQVEGIEIILIPDMETAIDKYQIYQMIHLLLYCLRLTQRHLSYFKHYPNGMLSMLFRPLVFSLLYQKQEILFCIMGNY